MSRGSLLCSLHFSFFAAKKWMKKRGETKVYSVSSALQTNLSKAVQNIDLCLGKRPCKTDINYTTIASGSPHMRKKSRCKIFTKHFLSLSSKHPGTKYRICCCYCSSTRSTNFGFHFILKLNKICHNCTQCNPPYQRKKIFCSVRINYIDILKFRGFATYNVIIVEKNMICLLEGILKCLTLSGNNRRIYWDIRKRWRTNYRHWVDKNIKICYIALWENCIILAKNCLIWLLKKNS